mgnify:CR=1 FL=1
MKINFTKKQFRLLLDIVYAADMVINGCRLPDEEIKKYKDIQQYIYSFSKDFGYDNLIEYSRKYDMFFETKELDESPINDLIDEYDNNMFWTLLASNLAERDIAKKLEGQEDVAHMEALGMVWGREEEYNDEFYKNGLDNVKVDIKP